MRTTRVVTVFAALGASTALLAGCAAGPSVVEVTYLGEAHSITLENVECSFSSDRSTVRLKNHWDAISANGITDFNAEKLGADGSVKIVTVRVSEGVYFFSSYGFELTEDGFVADNLRGQVYAHDEGSGAEDKKLDGDASLTGRVAC